MEMYIHQKMYIIKRVGLLCKNSDPALFCEKTAPFHLIFKNNIVYL